MGPGTRVGERDSQRPSLPTAQRIGCPNTQLGKLWAILPASTFKAANPGAEMFLDQSPLSECITWRPATSQQPLLELVKMPGALTQLTGA